MDYELWMLVSGFWIQDTCFRLLVNGQRLTVLPIAHRLLPTAHFNNLHSLHLLSYLHPDKIHPIRQVTDVKCNLMLPGLLYFTQQCPDPYAMY